MSEWVSESETADTCSSIKDSRFCSLFNHGRGFFAGRRCGSIVCSGLRLLDDDDDDEEPSIAAALGTPAADSAAADALDWNMQTKFAWLTASLHRQTPFMLCILKKLFKK